MQGKLSTCSQKSIKIFGLCKNSHYKLLLSSIYLTSMETSLLYGSISCFVGDDFAHGKARWVIACSHWLIFLPSCQIVCAVMPLWFNEQIADSQLGLICCHTTQGKAWHESSAHYMILLFLKTPASHPWLRKVNDRSTQPLTSATFHLDYFKWKKSLYMMSLGGRCQA